MRNIDISDYLKNKTVLVTGGTGSFGEYLVRKLITLPVKKIIVFSRDEEKQFQLRNELEEFKTKLEFRIGDVRNFDSLLQACRNVNIVYHAAAMKHVPISEENPMEAVFTNINGAYNLKEVAIRNKVEKVIAISTDKAVRSVNVMGMTKAIQERILLSDSISYDTQFVCVRFGNVVGSRGSVVPLFKNLIKNGKPVPLTDRRMTRFLIKLEDALDLIFYATLNSEGRKIFVKKMPVCNIYDLAEVMVEEITGMKIDEYKLNIVGLRQGEQLYESLISEEEVGRTEEKDDFFIIYPYGSKNKINEPAFTEYRTDLIKERMNKEDILSLLKKSNCL